MTALLFEKSGFVATLTINRPESRNILGEEGDGALFAAAVKDINADAALRCVVLTGAGPAFSAGGNVRAMRDRTGTFAGTADQIRAGYKENIHRVVQSLWDIEVPLIAAVNGAAIGLGNDVACLADIRIASDNAIFGATFLKVGLVPGDGGSWLLPRIIGHARASELFFTGDTIDARTALAWGLISRVVPSSVLMEEAMGLATMIARQPPGVLRATKKLMRESLTADFATIMDRSATAQAQAHLSEDHAEALAAMFEKRQPIFKGR